MFRQYTTPQLLLLALAALIAAHAVAILGLSARHISYVLNQYRDKHNFLDIEYLEWNETAGYRQSYYATIDYLPPQGFSLAEVHILLAAGVVGVLCGTLALVAEARERAWVVNLDVSGKGVRAVHVGTRRQLYVLDAFLATVTFAFASFVWIQHGLGNSYLWIGNETMDNGHATQRYAFGRWTFEHWHCAVEGYVSRAATHPSQRKMQRLCNQSRAARGIALPMLLLCVMRVGVQYWAWRKHNIAVRKSNEARMLDKEMDSAASESTTMAEGESRDGVSSEEASFCEVAELPAGRTSRLEAPSDVELKEMLAEVRQPEMDGGVAAAELPGHVKT